MLKTQQLYVRGDKLGKINSKQKGSAGEREWASFCREQGYSECRRTAQYCGNTGDASDVVGLDYMHQEVKRVEALNVYKAIEQAENDSKKFKKIPMVAHRKNRKKWLVTMYAEDWFKLYNEYYSSMKLNELDQNN